MPAASVYPSCPSDLANTLARCTDGAVVRSGRTRNALLFPEEDHCNVRTMERVVFKRKAPISINLQNFLGAGDTTFRARRWAPRRGAGGGS